MILKTNLHFHANEDPTHSIEYSVLEGIDYASKLDFQVLALTCHNKVALIEEHKKYALSKNILLISGVEINIGEKPEDGRHLLILNCDKEAEEIKTFQDLEIYKKNHPEIFVIAPHPFFPSFFKKQSLLEYTDKYIHLFDAIEHSWFYSKLINKNIPAVKLAQKRNKPLISTSDTHFMDFLDTDYCLIETEEKTPEAIFQSLKKHTFKNVTRPKKLLKEMIWTLGSFYIKNNTKK